MGMSADFAIAIQFGATMCAWARRFRASVIPVFALQ
jgi:hypothetical protein